MSVEVTGVHPQAECWPGLPGKGQHLVGWNLKEQVYVTAKESEKYPGYFDTFIIDRTESLESLKPVCGSFLRKFIHLSLSKDCELKWNVEDIPQGPKTIKQSCVYFISDEDGNIKIGTAISVLSRLDQLQTGNAQKLTLLTTIPGNRTVEHQLHKRFSADRIHDEWFRPSPELMAYLKEVQA